MANNQQQPAQTPQPQTPQKQPQPKKGTKVALIITIVVLVLLVLGAGVGYYVYSKAKKVVKEVIETAPVTTPTPSEKEGELPSSDVAGSDITGIPRYPKSVRAEYYKGPQDIWIYVVYKVKATQDQVLDYYKQELAAKGWQLSSATEKTLTFSKNASQLGLSVQESAGITQYELSYYPGPSD